MDPVQNVSVDASTNVQGFFAYLDYLFCSSVWERFKDFQGYLYIFTQCNTPLPSIIKYCQVKARLLQQLRRSLV